jgi:hypothetical protein
MLPMTLADAKTPGELARWMLLLGCPGEMFDDLVHMVLRQSSGFHGFLTPQEVWQELDPEQTSGRLWAICSDSVRRLEDQFRAERMVGPLDVERWRALSVLESLARAAREPSEGLPRQ